MPATTLTHPTSTWTQRAALGKQTESTLTEYLQQQGWGIELYRQELDQPCLRQRYGNQRFAKYQRDARLSLAGLPQVAEACGLSPERSHGTFSIEIKGSPKPYPHPAGILVGECRHWDQLRFNPLLLIWVPSTGPKDALWAPCRKHQRNAWAVRDVGYGDSYSVPLYLWHRLDTLL